MRIAMKQRFSGWMAVLLLAAMAFAMPQVASAQFTHVGDVKIDGSLAIGLDTLSSTSFGFDTMRLRENNLRIHFDDTSNTASFPDNDWRLIANDSSNGGGEYFAIEDASASRQVFRVDAGARSNALYVDSQGDVGLGTNTPALDIDIKTGNTPSVRLQQDGTSGFAPQTWDMAGNETNFFIRDATSGSTLPFRIRTGGAPSSSLDIHSDGDIGMGTSSPAQALHVRRTGAVAVEVLVDAANGTTQQARLSLKNQEREFKLINNGNRMQWFDITAGFESFTIRGTTGRAGFRNNNPLHPIQVGTDATNGNTAHVTVDGVWTDGSSRTLKERIEDLDGEAARQAFDQLNPVTYYGKNSVSNEQYVGFIAEDVPDLVAMNDRKGLAPIEIAAVLTKVVQQQRDTIAELTERLERLEAAQAAK